MKNLNQGGKIDLILTEAIEVAHHFHTRERWFGISADQSGDDWALSGTLNPFVAQAGAGDWGTWIKILGPDDTPAIAGMINFDFHRVVISDVNVLTPYIIQIGWGESGAAALLAETFTEFMYVSSTDNPAKAGGGPMNILSPKIDAGTKVWARIKCATNDTMDFFIGIHEYEE